MKKKIIIIDDDVDLVEAMRLTLEKEGFEVLRTKIGIEKL